MVKEKKNITTITLMPKVKIQAIKRAKELKRSLSSHIEFLIEQDLKLKEAI